MTSNSQSEVLGTTELLQNILLHLDLKTLLISAQLVERRWRNLISDSAVLQQALFFRGVPEPPRYEKTTGAHEPGGDASNDGQISELGHAVINPLLREKFAPFFHDARRDAKATADMGGSARRLSLLRGRRQSQTCMILSKHFPALPLAVSEAARAAFLRPEASWRRMLVTQPPARRLGFSEERSGMGGTGYRFGELLLDGDGGDSDEEGGRKGGGGGLRMGQLYDAAASWVVAHANFGIVWNPAEFRWPASDDHRTRPVNREEKSALAGRVDVLFALRHSSGCTGPSRAAREQIARDWDAFRARFFHPGGRGRPSLQATTSMRWKKHRMDGTVAEEEFGWVES
ncbi:F-box domain protein [Apiospora marii]|uniref:F-box domain protein n=1 Tax=Apiospora marii TaxID=335849 RepID=A0ABR1SIZ1_9PEZI